MTPSSRNPMKVPTPAIKPVSFPRHSILAEEVRRRDVRLVREKGYKQQCIDVILRFLDDNGYEGQVSQKILHNPSSKDFQSIFRFLYGFIDEFEFSSRFEDDVVGIMKNLKYPYCGEITKSQLSAITPHTWPVILSMCFWLVELITHSYSIGESEEKSIEDHFLDYVCNGYMKFMEGDENDATLEEEFERKVTEMYTGTFDEIDVRKAELSSLEAKIAEIKKVFEVGVQLDKRKAELSEDLNMLIASEKQLNGKKDKYLNSIARLNEDIRGVEEEVESLRKQEEELQKQITRQKINPEDIKEMNVEKMEMFKELERIKPEKEGLMRTINGLEKELQEKTEELEKLFFDFKSLRNEFSLKILKESKEGSRSLVRIVNESNGQVFESGASEVVGYLEDELNAKRDGLVGNEINKNILEENKKEKEDITNELSNRLKYCNDKLVTTGKLYLEKKEISENEQRKSKTEMEMLESELLKLNLESNTSLLMSEQKLHKARILLDRTLDFINYEKEEINKIVFNFYNMVGDIFGAIQGQVDELRSLVN